MSGCDTLQEKCIIRILEFPAVQLLWLHAIGLSHFVKTGMLSWNEGSLTIV